MLDYAGHGEHPVKINDSTRSMQITEVRFAYETLAKTYENIIVIGGSFGGYLAANLLDLGPKAAVLRVPAIYNEQQDDTKYADVYDNEEDYANRYSRENFGRIVTDRTLSLVANFSNMIYVVRHENDVIIPKWIPDLYFNTAKRGNYLLVPGAEHAPKTLADAGMAAKYYEYIEKMVVDIIYWEMLAAKNKL